MQNSITIQNLKIVLGDNFDQPLCFSILEFLVPAKSNLALTGPSGCGKSTLLNVLSGLMPYENGSVIVLNQELNQLSSSELDSFRGKHIGYIYQNFNLINNFNSLENVLIGMRFGRKINPKEWHERALHLLERVGLSHRTHSKVEHLSIGEKQRVAIARAIANKPEIILADEPTGSLDPHNAQEVIELLLEIAQEEQATFICVTHDHAIARLFSNQFDCQNLMQQPEVNA